MAEVIPLKIGANGAQELGATDTIPLGNLNATATPTASKVVVADGSGKLDSGWMPSGVGAMTDSIVTSENLAAGDIVNVYDNASTPTARKADASAIGTRAWGYVIAGTTSPAAATVYLGDGIITGLSGLTGGTQYYLSETAGGLTATAPTTSGAIVQSVGVALSTTELAFKMGTPYIRA